jgi:glycosyltransferase involved in cell wall biosynthesis
MEGMRNVTDAQPVCCIVDPSLRDFVGHHFSYDNALAAGAADAGFRPVILAHKAVSATISGRVHLRPCFHRDIWAASPLARYLPAQHRAEGAIRLANRGFLRDLKAGMRGLALPPGSVLFAHMIFRHQLPALASFVRDQPPDGALTVILLLRYQLAFYDNPQCYQAFRVLERAAASGRRVRIASDSTRLARDLRALTTLPIEVMPIPHTSADAVPGPAHGPRMRFTSLGNARDEKGFVEILDAIRMLHAESGLDDMEFVLQSNDAQPDVQAAIDAFARQGLPHVTLLREALSPEGYAAELAASDVVLVPYWREIYQARTSGVFLEAAAAGKPVIATRDTWMSDEMGRYGAGILVDDHAPRAIADAIRAAVRDRAGLAARAEAGRGGCLAIHNPAALVRQIVDGPPPAEPRAIRNVVIFYPWGDFLSRKAGASLRTNLLADMLAPHVDSVRVLQAGAAPTTRRGNVLVESAPLRIRQRLVRRAFRLPFRLLLGRAHFGQELPLWFHLERWLDPIFRRKVEDLVRGADAVLLEYSFWGGIVLPACRRAGIPCVLTNYDILSDQVTASKLLRRLTWQAERTSLAAADAVVTVAPGDQRALAAAGISSHMIPNPVDMDRASLRVPADPRVLLRVLYGVDLPPGPCCVFVGSWFPPNVLSVERIRTIAPMVPEAGFVVAGAAAPPGRDGNVLALGLVEDTVLTLLYRAASLVVIPLPYGTGASLKTVEAMGAGLTVLGTSVAFRGLDVRSGENCILEDDLGRWPALIGALITEPNRLAALGAGARRFAEGYDFRRVFTAYFPLLGMAVDPARTEATAAETRRAAANRLQDELVAHAMHGQHPGGTEIAMSFLLDEPLAPADAREAQLRRALLTCLDRRLFALAGRLLRLAELMAAESDSPAAG